MTLKLDKVNRGPHLSTLVASSISREIAQGRLKPGDQLPTEQALATTFGVSRNVVREAIARLRSEGRIWSQQGRGAFVADANNPTVLTIDYEALQRADAFRSLFELRGILEVQAAALAAKTAHRRRLAAMKRGAGRHARGTLRQRRLAAQTISSSTAPSPRRRATATWASSWSSFPNACAKASLPPATSRNRTTWRASRSASTSAS